MIILMNKSQNNNRKQTNKGPQTCPRTWEWPPLQQLQPATARHRPPALRSEPVPVLHGRCPPATARSGPVRTCAPHSCGWQTRARAQQVSGVQAGGGGNGGPWEHALVRLSRHGPPRPSPTTHAGDTHQQPLVPSVETAWVSGDQCRLSREPRHIQGCWECGDQCDLWASTGPS